MNKKLSGVFAFTAEMNQRMIELSQKAQAAIDAGDPSAEITLSDGSTRGADTVRKAVAGAMSGDLKTFEGWKKFANTYFRDLKEGQQLGHENIAVATATAAMYLKGMAHDDPLRPALWRLRHLRPPAASEERRRRCRHCAPTAPPLAARICGGCMAAARA